METPAEGVGPTRVIPTKPKPNKKRARVQVDYRYAIGRRVKELVDVFRARIGADADDLVLSTAIRRCAETIALSEQVRAQALRGVPGASVDDALRLSRSAEAMTRRLIDRRNTKQQQPSLIDYLAMRGGQPQPGGRD
jgi:hypothetical protein